MYENPDLRGVAAHVLLDVAYSTPDTIYPCRLSRCAPVFHLPTLPFVAWSVNVQGRQIHLLTDLASAKLFICCFFQHPKLAIAEWSCWLF